MCRALGVGVKVSVGTALSCRPPHRSQRAELPHWAPTSGVWRRIDRLGTGAGSWGRGKGDKYIIDDRLVEWLVES